MPDRAKLAEEWFVFGERDLQAAKALMGREGLTDIISMLVQQAVEKYLKGFLIYHGWKLRKTHDLRRLVAEASKYDPGLADFRDFARKATAYYLEHRYPPGPPNDHPAEEIADLLEQTEKLVSRIREATH